MTLASCLWLAYYLSSLVVAGAALGLRDVDGLIRALSGSRRRPEPPTWYLTLAVVLGPITLLGVLVYWVAVKRRR